MVNLCKFKKYRGRGKKMERQLKQFFDFLENDKKLSENTLQSYKRDLKQFRKYLESYGLHYNRVKEEDMENYIKELQEQAGRMMTNGSPTTHKAAEYTIVGGIQRRANRDLNHRAAENCTQ